MKFATRHTIFSRFGSLALLTSLATASLGNALVPAETASAAALNITVGPERTLNPGDQPNPREPIQDAILVSGSGNAVSLQQILDDPDVAPTGYIQKISDGVWQLNKSLIIGTGVTLELTPAAGVTELRLRSVPSATTYTAACGNEPKPACDYASFAYLRTNNGVINIAGTSAANRVKVHSWNGSGVDTDYKNGRGYILAKFDAALNIRFAELSYLGSGDGESYGVSWRDINASATPDVLRRRVTGQVLDSLFHHNYYGVYTYQASNMSFLRNKFYQNIEYGFDPHDYTTNVLVEDNEAYQNGNHGFIISRGCTNFTFRRNKSYNNITDQSDPDPARAHGFMLDPGSPFSEYPRVPSSNNLLENNEAWGNEGYGLRILGSTNNIVRNNKFNSNREGITVEEASTGNQLLNNTIQDNTNNGIFVRGTANNTTITGNTITGNTSVGLYIKSNGNTISGNTISGTKVGDGLSLQPETTTAQAVDDLTAPGEIASAATYDSQEVGPIVAQNTLAGNTVTGNNITTNGMHGIEFKKVVNTRVEGNTSASNKMHGLYIDDASTGNQIIKNVFQGNSGNGVRINEATSVGNTLSENQIYNNTLGGIATTKLSNGGIKAPVITAVQGNQVTGTTAPGAVVEIFSDIGKQGQYFEGRTTADQAGSFTFTKTGGFRAVNVNATATDANGNTSAFSIDAPFAVTRLKIFMPMAAR